MTRRGRRRAFVVGVGVGTALAALACFENPTSPAQCPDFCPQQRFATVESVFTTAIGGDSSFEGYVTPGRGQWLLATATPDLDSRPILQTQGMTIRYPIDTGSDTTTGPIVVDSMKLTLILLRYDTVPHNLRVSVYRLPLGIDSTTSLASLAGAFAAAPIREVNVDSLVAQQFDPVTGDTLLSLDTLRRATTIRLKFDSALTGYSEADSGRIALGFRVTADTAISIALGSSRSGLAPSASWFFRVDSAGVLLSPDSLVRPVPDSIYRLPTFDSFIYDVPAVTVDSSLIIGGIPSSRALLRVTLPRAIRDSSQIIRATLLLVADNPPPVVAPDSAFVRVQRVQADLGAKSPAVNDTTTEGHSAVFFGAPPDTVAIEVTNLLRRWQVDTLAPTTLSVQLLALDRNPTIADSAGRFSPEGATFSTLRFFSSRTRARRPALRLTYVPRLTFGAR